MKNIFFDNSDKIGLEVYRWLKDHLKELDDDPYTVHTTHLCPDGRRMYHIKMLIEDITATPDYAQYHNHRKPKEINNE